MEHRQKRECWKTELCPENDETCSGARIVVKKIVGGYRTFAQGRRQSCPTLCMNIISAAVS